MEWCHYMAIQRQRFMYIESVPLERDYRRWYLNIQLHP